MKRSTYTKQSKVLSIFFSRQWWLTFFSFLILLIVSVTSCLSTLIVFCFQSFPLSILVFFLCFFLRLFVSLGCRCIYINWTPFPIRTQHIFNHIIMSLELLFLVVVVLVFRRQSLVVCNMPWTNQSHPPI